MSPIECIARRERLGASTIEWARMLDVSVDDVDAWESGREPIPDTSIEYMRRWEKFVDDLVQRSIDVADAARAEHLEPVLHTYVNDDALASQAPNLARVPASVHRVAIAHAALRSNARIVSARAADTQADG